MFVFLTLSNASIDFSLSTHEVVFNKMLGNFH